MNWEAVNAIIGGIYLVSTIIMGIGLSRKADKDDLEKMLNVRAKIIVDQQFQMVSLEFRGMVNALKSTMEGVDKRLARGDDAFDKQGEAQQSLEKTVLERESKTMKWAMELFGTQEEVSAITRRLGLLEVQAGRFDERIHHVEASQELQEKRCDQRHMEFKR